MTKLCLDVKISIENVNSREKKTEMLCGFVIENSDKVLGLDKTLYNEHVKQSLTDMGGKFAKTVVIPSNQKAKRILLAGLGKKEKISSDTIRFVSGKIAQIAKELKLKEFSIILPSESSFDLESSVTQVIEGCKLSSYKFETYKTEKGHTSPDISILSADSKKIMKTAKIAEIIADGSIFTKSIANQF